MKYEDLSKLAMWEDWQRIVQRSLPNFAESPIYVQQRSQTNEEFEAAAEYVSGLKYLIDKGGQTRDAAYGGVVRETKACGPCTRMWLDTNVEGDFLIKYIGSDTLHTFNVLEIGAGYGRLAVPLSRLVNEYVCVDPVPISTVVCGEYTQRYAPKVLVPSLHKYLEELSLYNHDLAINIHSWNECSFDQVANWIKLLKQKQVPYLFTVSNGSILGGRQAYSTWGGKGDSFRPLLEADYNLIVEESIGLSLHPHALWRLKESC